jgi:hypothetical protein
MTLDTQSDGHTWKDLEELIQEVIQSYEDGYNEINKEQEIKFTLSLTNHNVEVANMKKWVAYLRLERMIRPKGGKEEDWEHMLIYNQAYKFKDSGERANPACPWKHPLYMDLLGRLISGGLEYSELLKRLQNFSKQNAGKPVSNIVAPEGPDILITDQMPAPLTDDEKSYQEWVKRNKQSGS